MEEIDKAVNDKLEKYRKIDKEESKKDKDNK
jgi:hypothetical protein